jgi:hypothetical protein
VLQAFRQVFENSKYFNKIQNTSINERAMTNAKAQMSKLVRRSLADKSPMIQVK